MGEKKGEDLYRNFSRKDIQSLCKKYGLPANKSNFEMATSLILYLENKNLKSRIMWEASRSDPCPSGRSNLQIGAGMISTGDWSKDNRGNVSRSGSGNNRHNNQDVRQKDPQNCDAIMTSDKASENADVLAQLNKNSNTGAGLLENALSGASSSVPARSTDFQFDVRSENGIQICVDLNSNTSDWIESMKSGVHICQYHDVHGHMLQGFQEDLGHMCSKQLKSSSVVDSDKGMNSDNFEDGCSPARLGAAAGAQASEPEAREGSLKSCSNTSHSQENMGEKQVILPLRIESDKEKEVSGVKYCERDGKNVPAVSAVNILAKSRTCNFSGKSCDPKYSGTLENQELTAGNGIFERFSPQQTNSFLNTALKYMEPPTFATVDTHASPFATLGGGVGPSSSRNSVSMGVADQLQHYEGEHRRFPQSLQFHGNRHRLQSVEAADVSRYRACSNKSGSLKDELHRPEVPSKSRGQVTETQTHLPTYLRESMSLSPYKRYSPLDVHLTNTVEIDNGCFLRPPKPGQGHVHSSTVVVERDVSLSPGNNGMFMDFVVPEKNGAGHCILTCSNKLDAENRNRQPATSVGNVVMNHAGHGKESSECLERGLMEGTCIKVPNSESNRELKRKRQFSGVEDQSNYVNSGSWILRTSEHSSGDVRANCRKSSRFSTK